MRTLLFAIAAMLALAAVPALAQSTYDDTWYRAPYWSGEYPGGFSVAKTTTVQLRPTLDVTAEQTIACELPQGATYQTWNQSRVEEQGLHFVSFSKIATYKITEPYEATLYNHLDGTELKVAFKKGDTFRYLVYFGEGAFLLEYDGVEYDGDQDLFEHSVQQGDSNGYEEWLRINCSNNQWGWLYMGDIDLEGGVFVGPNITGYGTAEDLK